MARPTISTKFTADDRITSKMKAMRKSVLRFSATIVGAGGLVAGFRSITKEASKIEDAVAGFTPLMGGVEKANKLVAALNKTAATTPFQFENISKAAKQLLPVMNQDIEKTVDTFRMLGDTAGGNAQKLDSITRGFTKSMLKGKVDMESLNMIAEAGVPIYKELSASMGVSVQEMMAMSRAGKISSTDLENAFKRMTSEGGIFYKGMEIASKTLSGKMSTLKDNIKLTAATLGMKLLPTIKPLIDKMIEATGKVREWIDANKDLINQKIQDTFNGIRKTVKIIVKLWDSGLIPALLTSIAVYKTLTTTIIVYKKALAFAKAVQLAFNVAMTANPIGLIIAAIAVLIGLIVLLAKNWDKVTVALKRVWNWFSKLLDNPIIAAAATVFAPFIAIPALIIKHWTPIKEFFVGLWEKVKPIIDAIGGFFKGGNGTGPTMADYEAQGRDRLGNEYAGLIGRNDAVIQSNSTVTNRSMVDINMTGLPVGTSVKQTGKAPGVTMNYGYAGAQF